MTASQPGRFGTVIIQGVGLIGGSIGLALKRRGLCSKVIGVGRSDVSLNEALSRGAVDEISLDIAASAGLADVIILCTPVSQIVAELPVVLAHAPVGAVVTDVGSVKSEIVRAANGDPRFVGGHPMAGAELAGVRAARAELFNEATWAITPENASAASTAVVEDLAKSLGARVEILSPEQHDSSVAVTSHLPHVLATSLMRSAVHADVLSSLSAGSFADATRVAASSPALWRDIYLQNRVHIVPAINRLLAVIGEMRDAIDQQDAESLEGQLREGAEQKRNWAS